MRSCVVATTGNRTNRSRRDDSHETHLEGAVQAQPLSVHSTGLQSFEMPEGTFLLLPGWWISLTLWLIIVGINVRRWGQSVFLWSELRRLDRASTASAEINQTGVAGLGLRLPRRPH